jgi:hypothetical protein
LIFNSLSRIEDNQSNNLKSSKVVILEVNHNGAVLEKKKEGILRLKSLLAWIVFCIACSFVAAIFISAVGISFVDLYNTPKMESICHPIVNRRKLSNQVE